MTDSSTKEMRIFETLFDMLPFGVYVADVETLEIVYVNRYFKDRVLISSSNKCYSVIYGSDNPCIFCKIGELLSEKKSPNSKTIVYDNFNEMDEKWYRVEEKCIYWPDGKLVKYSICVDITELKTVQNKLSESHAELILKNKEIERNNQYLKEILEELERSKSEGKG